MEIDDENTKEVLYGLWCKKCVYWNNKEDDDPCNECLTTPYNYASSKPINFVSNESD